MADHNELLLRTFAQHRSALTRFLARRLGNSEMAEDFTQETWLRAARTDGVIALGNPRGYLFRIAANLVLDYQRHVAHRIEVEASDLVKAAIPDPQPSPEAVILHRREYVRLLQAVENLAPRRRQVFILAKFEDMSYAEIAERLGISRNTVVTHMVHALAALEQAMNGKDEKS